MPEHALNRHSAGDDGLFTVEKGVLRANGDMHWESVRRRLPGSAGHAPQPD